MMHETVDEVAHEHLDVVRIKEDYISAHCPFHGPDRHPSFWMERETGKFGCFACGAHGSGLKWFLKELGVKNRSIEHIIKEAEKDRHHRAKISKIRQAKKAKSSFTGVSTLPESLLGLWDYCPTALLEAGFQEDILQAHDIGFDEERLRITFPIRDIHGNLIGISGRSVDGSHPKYKVYQGYHNIRKYDGTTERVPGELGRWYPNYSSEDIRDHLYRGNFVYTPCFNGIVDNPRLIVVEGYKAALWLVQLGFPFVVALMGARLSSTQERLLRRIAVPTYILLDNNDAGQSGADQAASRMGNCSFPVYRCYYPEHADEEMQPDDLADADQVEEVLRTAPRAVRKIRRQKWF